MQRIIGFWSIVFLTTTFLSCSKFEPEPEPELEIGYFNKLKVQGAVDVYLVNGTSNEIVSTTLDNENFHEQGDNMLFIQAGSGSVTISVSDLSYIWCQSCEIHVEDQVSLPFLEMDLYGGDLAIANLITDSLDIYSTGTAILEIAGNTTKANISLGPGTSIESYDLVCDTLDLSTNDGNAEVHVTSFLSVFVASSGNTIYKGTPDSVYVSGLGPGTVTPF